MRPTTKRLIVIAVLAVLGFLVSGCITLVSYVLPQQDRFEFLAQEVPLPHHVPKYQGGLSFRFVMAHDVIHERFPKHGREHYLERNRVTEAQMAELSTDDPQRWLLADDLAVGLDRLGEPAQSVEIMREKLREQEAQGVTGRDLYTSYANLGTFLIHSSFARAMQQDSEAIERFREGVEFIHKSVEVNPAAHFGREAWQAAIAEFLLASFQNPELLREYDCLGNSLALPVGTILNREEYGYYNGYGRSYLLPFSKPSAEREVPAFFAPGVDPADEDRWQTLKGVRQFITAVGAEPDWQEVDVPSHREPVPFDEPMLGIIGMWRQGGGANPHFALAIAETMLRVGQRYIAWTAFARAKQMAERYSPDPELQQFLREHCTQRQREIEATISAGDDTASSDEESLSQSRSLNQEANRSQLQITFEDELAYGEAWQAAYQTYEAEQLAAGRDLHADDFFDDFYRNRDPIASTPGREEQYRYVSRQRIDAFGRRHALAAGIFGAGCFAMVPIVIPWLWSLLRKAFSALFARLAPQSDSQGQ